MTEDTVTFVDELPKSVRGRREDHRRKLDALRSRPGQWALFNSYSTRGTSYTMRHYYMKIYAGEGFEFTARGADLYGRFLAPAE